MVRVLNKYELIRNGRRLEVYLKYDEYDNYNSLAASLYFEPVIMNEPIYEMTDSLDLFSSLELFAVITINLPESADLPFGTQFIDVNNHPWVDGWLIDNSIAEPIGKFAKCGFCIYPAFKFNLQESGEKNMEYGQVTVDDGKNGRMINNDPYDWSPKHNKPRYLIDLLLSVINVSI